MIRCNMEAPFLIKPPTTSSILNLMEEKDMMIRVPTT